MTAPTPTDAPSQDPESPPTPAPPARRGRRIIRSLLLITAVVYACWCGIVYVYQDQLLFPAPTLVPRAGDTRLPPGAIVLHETGGGESVEAWLLPAAPPSPSHPALPAPTLVFFHGNGEIIDYLLPEAAAFTSRGMNVLLIEYRGYGRSSGKPSQRGIVADSQRLLDQLDTHPIVDTHRLVYFGRSLGGGVACAIAAERPPAALILQSTFTSVASFAWGMGVPPLLCKHPFRNDRILARADFPVLIFHGDADEFIPVEHGRRLHALVHGSTYHEHEGDGHNDFPRDRGLYEKQVFEFLQPRGLVD